MQKQRKADKKEEPTSSRKSDEKLKKNVSTPRSFVQKSSTADIYGQKNTVQSARAPKKVGSSITSNASPMKDYLKSSPSSVSQISYDKIPKFKKELKPQDSARRTPKATPRSVPFSNVTVNSPIAKRKLTLNRESEKVFKKIDSSSDTKLKNPDKNTQKEHKADTKSRTADKNDKKSQTTAKDDTKTKTTDKIDTKSRTTDKDDTKPKSTEKNSKNAIDTIDTRQRTKTRTLAEDEVKILTPEVVDNNTQMMNLSRKLSAKPTAFYVGLDDTEIKNDQKEESKTSDEEYNYEDDFESYESDFDSYHSDGSKVSTGETGEEVTDVASNEEEAINGEQGGENNDGESSEEDGEENIEVVDGNVEVNGSIVKDEEKMLDSGSYDLRDQRSATRKPTFMEFIPEAGEDMDEKKPSLPDEGFLDMTTSSGLSSMKHVDVLEKPLFINFAKSKENKRKKRTFDLLKQRAQDLLSMITLHEMSYSLFELKPIPYDLYMATFGRSNYTQIAVQTFDDGITEEIQTDEILIENKWTQCPVEFSKHDIYLDNYDKNRKYGNNPEDYLTKFTFLINEKADGRISNEINLDTDYITNPLRIYLEQKDGAGSCHMLPFEKYKSKLDNFDYNPKRLGKFLKKSERRISNILNINTGHEISDLTKSTKLPFSKGFIPIKPADTSQKKIFENTAIQNVIISENKPNLILTIHKKILNGDMAGRCLICLWDLSNVRKESNKILVAIGSITIGRFRGNTNGLFVAALEDGSIHLWDLSEDPTWRTGVANSEKQEIVEVNTDKLTQIEIDREWNLKNSQVGLEEPTFEGYLQSCSYTSSAANINNNNYDNVIDSIVGLEFVEDATISQDGGRKIVGQVCSLQKLGILKIWSIIQMKTKLLDIGQAYWSKMKLERTQTIYLLDHIESTQNIDNKTFFNLNAAKKRLCNRKMFVKSRPKSSEFEKNGEKSSVASLKKTLSKESEVFNWENGVVCCDFKIARLDGNEYYLVGKNCGEVLCCMRNVGGVKINRFFVANDNSSISRLAVSSHKLPYFLAATDSGTVNLCSLLDGRVLLTLDCRNSPPGESGDKCTADSKGRFVSSKPVRSPSHSHMYDSKHDCKSSVTSLHWSSYNPCVISCALRSHALCVWDLTHSDICARYIATNAVDTFAYADSTMFLHWSSYNPCVISCALRSHALCVWDLTHSDICARYTATNAVDTFAYADSTMALLTPDGEVQVHRLATEQKNKNLYLDLFQKYVSLL